MAKLTTKSRNALASSQFALPGRAYPVQDRNHAANAKSRAQQQYNAGNMSKSTLQKIDAKANKVLARKK
jgi:hypothetical protein